MRTSAAMCCPAACLGYGRFISRGLVADQPALYGLLAKIRDLGLCLISVRRL